ncbi:unnamed protein product [Withania somnifera]
MPWLIPRGVNNALSDEQVKGMPNKYDKDGDGKLTKKVLRLAFKEMEFHFCHCKVGKALRFVDKSSDGFVNEDEMK